VTYKQLLDEGAAKPAIAKLMERQHRLMIHQIREGRFDIETSDGVVRGSQPSLEDDAKIHTTRIQQQAEAMFGPAEEEGPPAEKDTGVEAQEAEAPTESEAAEVEGVAAEVEEAPSDPRVDERPTEEMPTDLPEAERPTEEMPVLAESEDDRDDEVELEVGPAPTLDQVIFDYLSSVAQEESLVLLMDESPALAAGATTRMDLGTHASRSGKPIANAVVAVRMISKTGGPVTLAEGTTDEEGTLQLVVEVPEVQRDSAALIITAASSIGNAEIKHLL